MSEDAIDLHETYVILGAEGAAKSTPGGAAFWEKLRSGEGPSGLADRAARLVMVASSSETWKHWEMHPAGDEIVLALSGAIELVLEQEGGERTVELRNGRAVIVPRGTWHRAIVHEPGRVLHITAGAGTQHRPV